MKRRMKKSLTILLDAGHGGRDAGASVKSPKGVAVIEKEFTLSLTKQVGEKLAVLGHTVHYTRIEDTYPDLPARIVLIKKHKADLLISIHGGMIAGGNPLPYSSIMFHAKRNDEKKLAEVIAQNLEKSAGEKARVVADSRHAPTGLFMLRESPCPAAMIEIGDMPKASVPSTQEKIVDAIVQGVQKYSG